MICNLMKQTVVSVKSLTAYGFLMRLRGMIGRKFDGFDAMVFPRCNSVHTFFMSQEIDLIFMNAENRVTHTVHQAKTWRPCFCSAEAVTVIEMPVGSLLKSGTEVGDVLDLNAEPEKSLKKKLKEKFVMEPAPAVAPLGDK